MRGIKLPQSIRKLVNGLRDAAPNSEVRVYSAKTHELLRIEKDEEFQRGNKNWGNRSGS